MPEFNPNVIGGLEIGVLLAILLYGIGTVQVYLYYRNFPDDPRLLKTVIAAVWIAETGHSICISWGIYEMTITHYGAPPGLVSIPRAFGAGATFGAIVHPLVQATFTYRIYQFSKNLYIPVLCWTASAYIFAGTLAFVGSSMAFAFPLTIELLDQYEDKWSWLIFSLFATSAFVDVMIAGTCCYFLRVNRSHALKRTASIIDKLMKWAIETGLVTSITAIVVVITFATMRDSKAWLSIFVFMTGLYPNTLLALLNGRLELANYNPTTTFGSFNEPHRPKFVPHMDVEMSLPMPKRSLSHQERSRFENLIEPNYMAIETDSSIVDESEVPANPGLDSIGN